MTKFKECLHGINCKIESELSAEDKTKHSINNALYLLKILTAKKKKKTVWIMKININCKTIPFVCSVALEHIFGSPIRKVLIWIKIDCFPLLEGGGELCQIHKRRREK